MVENDYGFVYPNLKLGVIYFPWKVESDRVQLSWRHLLAIATGGSHLGDAARSDVDDWEYVLRKGEPAMRIADTVSETGGRRPPLMYQSVVHVWRWSLQSYCILAVICAVLIYIRSKKNRGFATNWMISHSIPLDWKMRDGLRGDALQTGGAHITVIIR